MRSWIFSLGALWFAAIPSYLSAASPQYCAFYAREYSRQFSLGTSEAQTEIEIENQAYYRCLNQDEDPPLPEESAYSGDNLGSPSATVSQGDADDYGEVLSDPTATLAVRQESRTTRSGLAPWSVEWVSWCRKHFPNSFDDATGFVLPFRGRRSFC